MTPELLRAGPSASDGPLVLYEFRAPLLDALTRSLPLVVKGSRREVQRFIPLDEFGDLFGGYVLWTEPERPTREMPGDGLGVWGTRNVARLRRLMRERGAEIARVEGPGPPQQLKVVSQDYRHLNEIRHRELGTQPGRTDPESSSG